MQDFMLIKESSLLRDGIAKVLEYKFHTTVHAFGANENDKVIEYLNQCELIIIDLDTDLNIFSIIEQSKKDEQKVIVWSSSLDDSLLIPTFKLGLNGYFYNGMEGNEFIEAIKIILNGQKYVHPAITSILLNDYMKIQGVNTTRPVGLLTNREWEVFELVTKGYKNEQIGEMLFISNKTVKNHIGSILKKLKVTDRTNAVLLALKKRWVSI